MKKIALILFISLLSCNRPAEKNYRTQTKEEALQKERSLESLIREGDIIFQSTSGGQGKAIQMATNSEYSHVGILYQKEGNYYVFEAVQPVKVTPLKKWISRGDNDHYVIKRLIESEKYLTPENLKKMKKAGKKYLGKNYDLYFGWSDDRIYCSELVWKVYKEGSGVELGSLQKLKDFNLSNPIVQYKLKERYGKNIPYEEKVISPAAIFESDKLVEIFRN